MKFWIFILSAVSCTSICGCSIFLPKHNNSLDTKGENVSIRMLSKDQIDTIQYRGAFGNMSGCSRTYYQPITRERIAPLITTGASILAGFAIDQIKLAIQKDSDKYEAQFIGNILIDNYYKSKTTSTGNYYTGNYCGFEIVRNTTAHKPAFKAVFGIYGTNNRFLYKIAPLYFNTNSTKAKVLNTKWYSYFIPPFFWPLLLDDGNEINTNIELEFVSYWLTDEKYNIEKVASISHNYGNYNISDNLDLTSNGIGNNKLDSNTIGLFYVFPEFITNNNSSGILSIKAIVTEKDPSNAKVQLQKISDLVGQQKDKVVGYFKNYSSSK